ncbi:MAG: DUF2110 family protein [Candidatus Bathyarchaeia archaeon]
MPTVTLSLKIYNDDQLKNIKEHIKSSLKGLKVQIESVKAVLQGWIQVTLSGEDENAALSYLENMFGLCPIHINNITKFSIVRGYIIGLGKMEEELQLNIGPNIVNVTIPLQHLQAQLVDGRKIALKKIVELYGLCENMPLTVKVTSVSGNCLEAIIAEKQLEQYKRWVRLLLDRLIILGASQQEIRKALKEAKCQNDVVEIEELGFFEYDAICKLGVDAVGLIPKVGKKLPNATLHVFSPKKILEVSVLPFLDKFVLTV